MACSPASRRAEMAAATAEPAAASAPTRIQRRNRARILDAALPIFVANGFGGTTIDRIAQGAGLSKPNVLYYFSGKQAIYEALLETVLDRWLEPLEALDRDGEPLEQILAYIRRKLVMSREMPLESRLFAAEILQGAERIEDVLRGPLRRLVADRVAIIRNWIAEGRLAEVDPHHLIFSIWATTQHYADFDAQIVAVLGAGHDPLAEAELFLETLYRRLLAP